jgi:hypothetical protein
MVERQFSWVSKVEEIWHDLPEVQLWFCDGCGISSHPNLGIIFDVTEFQNLQKSSGLSEERMGSVAIFILAHELAHQVQYKVYTSALFARSVQEKRVLEAQADLLGTLNALRAIFLNDKDVLKSDLWRRYKDWVDVAFASGAERFSLSDHPARAARATAARLGIGALVAFSGDLSKEIAGHPWNVEDGEEELSWSLRTAKELCKSDQDAALQLVETERRLDWGDGKSGDFAYDITYHNRGDKELRVNLVVETVEAVNGDEAGNAALWDTTDMREHKFLLPPHGTYHVQGKLLWERKSHASVPMVNLPSEPGGIVSVSYTDGDPSPGAASANPEGLYFTEQRPEDFQVALSTLLAASDNFAALRVGIGVIKSGKAVYLLDPQLPGSLRTTVSLSDADVDHSTSLSVGYFTESAYKDGVRQIRESVKRGGGWKETILVTKDGTETGREFSRGQIRIEVELISYALFAVY